MFTNPAVSDFKSYFTRDFPYSTNCDEGILESDIQKAINQVAYKINESLFSDQTEYDIGYLLLSAHYLCMNIRASSQGLGSNFEWLLGSKSVGSISVSQSIPASILEDPSLAYYSSTGYGAEYLTMIYPKLMGTIFAVEGGTTA